MTDIQILAKMVRQMRKRFGWTLPELATKSNLPKATISKIENKKANPCLSTLTALARGFGVPTDWLLDDLNLSQERKEKDE